MAEGSADEHPFRMLRALHDFRQELSGLNDLDSKIGLKGRKLAFFLSKSLDLPNESRRLLETLNEFDRNLAENAGSLERERLRVRCVRAISAAERAIMANLL